MGKKSKKAESGKKEGGKKEVSSSVLAATQRIKVLCMSKGLVPTDTYAVKKSLVKADSFAVEERFTRWAKNAAGERCLVVLNGHCDAIKAYPDYATKFSSIKTIQC